MKSFDDINKLIWEKRYSSDSGVAKWPFDQIVSMVMRRFGTVNDRQKIKILDYGCGGGNNFWFLIREGFDAYACDIAPSAIYMTKHRIEKEEKIKLSEDHYNIIDIENEKPLQYPDNFFSAVIDRESLCQSSWDGIKNMTREFRRVLQPGGWYLGVNFTDHHPDVGYSSFLGNGDYHNFIKGLFKNQGRRHLFSITEINELFSDWDIEHVLHKKISSIINKSGNLDSSEYIIAAKVPV